MCNKATTFLQGCLENQHADYEWMLKFFNDALIK